MALRPHALHALQLGARPPSPCYLSIRRAQPWPVGYAPAASSPFSNGAPAGPVDDCPNLPRPPTIWPGVRRRLPRITTTDSAMIKPFEPLPDPHETLRNFRKHYGSWKLQLRLRRRRNASGRGHSETWRDIFNSLYQSTPARPSGGPWRYHSHLLVFQRDVERVLLEDPDDNIWNLYKITDCAFDGSWRRKSTDKAEMLLSGDKTSVDLALAMVEDICRRHNADAAPKLYSLPRTDEMPPPPPAQSNVRSYPPGAAAAAAAAAATAFPPGVGLVGVGVEDGRAEEPSISYETPVRSIYADALFNEDAPLSISRFDEVAQPTTLTRSTLCRYLHTLYRARIHPRKSIKAYGSLSEQHRTLSELLDSILDRAAGAGALSETSFRFAFRLLTKYSAPVPVLDDFVRRMDTVYRTSAVDNARLWNIYLETYINTHDLERFAVIVTRMAHRAVVPNRRTWHLFLQLVEDNTVKRHIVNGMHRKGLLGERRTTMLVAEEMSMHHTLLVCKLGLSLDQFMHLQALRFSPAWISPHTINNVVEAFCRYGRFDDCFRLLEYAHHPLMAQPTYPDPRSFFLIAYHARLQLDMRALANAVESVEQMGSDLLTSMFYDEIFLFALRGRSPALLAETWIFACLRHKLTRRIGILMAKNFQWLLARLLRRPGALAFDAHPASRDNTYLLPALLESVAESVMRNHRERGHDPSALLGDRTALLAECVGITRAIHKENTMTHSIGDRIFDIMTHDIKSVKEWRADRTVEGARRLGMIPLGILADDQGGFVIIDIDRDTDTNTLSAARGEVSANSENSEAADEGPEGIDYGVGT